MKKWIQGIALMTLCLLLFPISVSAAEPSVTLKEAENGTQVTMEIPSTEGMNAVTSLQLSFKTEVLQGKKDQMKASFVFEEGLPGVVKTYRYHPDNGRLTIYLSGRENLLSQEKQVLGRLILDTEDSAGVSAKVSVIPDSYVFVIEGGNRAESASVSAPGDQTVIIGNGGVEEQPEEKPEEKPEKPEEKPDKPEEKPDKPEEKPEGENQKPPVSGDTGSAQENSQKPQNNDGGDLINFDQVRESLLRQAAPDTGNHLNPGTSLTVLVILGLCLILLKAVDLKKEK